jgi:hypothetical protein
MAGDVVRPEPSASRWGPARLWVWLSAGLAVVLLGAALAYGVVRGPARDTDLARWIFGDLSRTDAVQACSDWVRDEIRQPGRTDLAEVSTRFGTDPGRWVVSGTVSQGDVSGPFHCTVEWYTSGPAAIYVTDLRVPGAGSR